jgi:outer membrane protein assembly factor BamD (BamD/ComL family)
MEQRRQFRYSYSMKSTHIKALVCTAALCLAAFCLSSCATTIVNIPEDLSPMEIIQKAQEASDRNRYNIAIQYYQALLERYSLYIDLVITAEYEIAFIHYKQKRYDQAKEEFLALLERYNTIDEEFLPPQFKILSNIVLERIEERLAQRRR